MCGTHCEGVHDDDLVESLEEASLISPPLEEASLISPPLEEASLISPSLEEASLIGAKKKYAWSESKKE